MVFFAVINWIGCLVFRLAHRLISAGKQMIDLTPHCEVVAWMTPVGFVCMQLVANAIRGAPPGYGGRNPRGLMPRLFPLAPNQLLTYAAFDHPAVLIAARLWNYGFAGPWIPAMVGSASRLRPATLPKNPSLKTANGDVFAQR
jgi:hypothetical protein